MTVYYILSEKCFFDNQNPWMHSISTEFLTFDGLTNFLEITLNLTSGNKWKEYCHLFPLVSHLFPPVNSSGLFGWLYGVKNNDTLVVVVVVASGQLTGLPCTDYRFLSARTSPRSGYRCDRSLLSRSGISSGSCPSPIAVASSLGLGSQVALN